MHPGKQDLIGRSLDHYRIVDLIGAGGMGAVYRGRDLQLDRDVAIKVLLEELADNPNRLRRFEREAKALAALSHPNILGIHDFGTDSGRSYAVMELLEGRSLREQLDRDGPFSWHETAEIGAAVADGLAAAHSKGVIHRDLKPSNLFLTDDSMVKILDFGLARVERLSQEEAANPCDATITRLGSVIGTTGYMSPEQVRGRTVDHRSDFFSLACVLYEMVAGAKAFEGDSDADTMAAILKEEPPELRSSGVRLPPELEGVIRRCLAKRPEARFQSAEDLAHALRLISSKTGARISRSTRPWRSFLRPRWWMAVAGAVLVVVGLVLYSEHLMDPLDSDGSPPQEDTTVAAVAAIPSISEREDPTSTPSMEAFRLYREGRRLVRNGRNAEAIEVTRQALEIDPEFIRAINQMAAATGNLGYASERERYRRRAFELREHLPLEWRIEVEAKHYLERDQTATDAIVAFERLRTHETGYHDINYTNFLNRIERFEEGAAVLEEVIAAQVAPSNWSGFSVTLAASLVGMGHFDDARRVLEDFIERHPESTPVRLALAEVSLYSRQFDRAAEEIEASGLDNDSPEFRFLAWRLAVVSGRWEEAERIAASSKDPWPVPRVLDLALRGRSGEVVTLLEKTVESTSDPFARARWRNSLAIAHLARGERESAHLQLEMSLQEGRNETFDRALFLQAVSLASYGDARGAAERAEQLERRAEQLPSDREMRRWHHLQGELALLRGDTAAAIAELELAESMLRPGSLLSHVSIWDSLARANEAAGDQAGEERTLLKIIDGGILRVEFPFIWVRSHYRMALLLESRGDRADRACELYRTFAELWADGDLDLDKVELARLKVRGDACLP